MTAELGLLEWLRPGEYVRAREVLQDLRVLGVTKLRLEVSWADYHTVQGPEWYDWLLGLLSKEVEILPCFHFTPPSLGIQPKISSPPQDPQWYADWLDGVISRHGSCFDCLELWNEPNNLSEWDWRLDPEWRSFCHMTGSAAYWAKQLGKRVVLGGMSPIDTHWLELMAQRGVLDYVDVVGIHAFPANWECDWPGWDDQIRQVRQTLEKNGHRQEVWITETGFSTWRHEEFRQAKVFIEAVDAPAERVYWYGVQDLDPDVPTIDGFHTDEREYHFGLKRADGSKKLLCRLLSRGGIQHARETAEIHRAQPRVPSRDSVLITGGAGFIGAHLADRMLRMGRPVIVYDNLSGPSAEDNLRWICGNHSSGLELWLNDLRDDLRLRDAVRRADVIFHLGAQISPRLAGKYALRTFDVNVRGMATMLDAMTSSGRHIPLVCVSTHKVYGSFQSLHLIEMPSRYEPADLSLQMFGFNEDTPTRPEDAYASGRLAAEQMVLAHVHDFHLDAAILRFSSVYGPRHHHSADTAWLSRLCGRAIVGQPAFVYGSGKQVRDLLFIDDAVDALLYAETQLKALQGGVFNVGAGASISASLLEVLAKLEKYRPKIRFFRWRLNDQRFFISDSRRFSEETGWSPRVSVEDGLRQLMEWTISRNAASANHVEGQVQCVQR